MTAKVVPMPTKPASPTTINPPEGWKDGEGFGFLYGHDAQGQPVDLVRLSDLVRWLQNTRKLSRKAALQVVIDALPTDTMQHLYRLQPGDGAALVSQDEFFGQMSADNLKHQIQQAKVECQEAANALGFGREW